MPKRVLVAESSSVIRGVAETLLRQNGYEVLSVGSYDKALEVLSFTRPDLLVIGGDLTNASGHKLFEQLQRDGKTASIPMLLFRDPEDMSLPFPDEVLVPRPFEAREFIEKVQVFSGMGNREEPREQANPLGAASLDDEFLDAALGLDKIDVTHSEVMNKTTGLKQGGQQKQSGQMLGIAHQTNEQQGMNDSTKVESLIISEDTSSISTRNAAAQSPKKGTSKLEILQDQYGMSDPRTLQPQANENHDYNWFINEMKQEVSIQPDAKASEAPKLAQTGGIKTTTAPVSTNVPANQVMPGGKGRTVGVEKFIDEFKKEIEKFRSDEPEPAPAAQAGGKGQQSAQGQKLVWEETVERLNADTVGMFTRQLAHDLAEKIAEKIVSKIDADKLLVLIKNELLSQSKKQ